MNAKNVTDIDKVAGELIRDRRKAKRWTQTQLGERVGLHVSTISAYEKATRQMDLLTFFKICHTLGIATEEVDSYLNHYLEKYYNK